MAPRGVAECGCLSTVAGPLQPCTFVKVRGDDDVALRHLRSRQPDARDRSCSRLGPISRTLHIVYVFRPRSRKSAGEGGACYQKSWGSARIVGTVLDRVLTWCQLAFRLFWTRFATSQPFRQEFRLDDARQASPPGRPMHRGKSRSADDQAIVRT